MCPQADQAISPRWQRAVMLALVRVMLAAAMTMLAAPALANVFGDGDPVNGLEDDRQDLNDRAAPGLATDAWRRASGTIFCDGALRGSAMLVDVRPMAPRSRGLYIATAAHVLLDLDNAQPFAECEFRFLGLGELPGYRWPIDSEWVRTGPFDALSDRQATAFGQHDWAFAYLGQQDGNMASRGRVRPGQPRVGGEGEDYPVFLVAFDAGRGRMAVSSNCHARFSRPGDLGGGGWPGQLLDDCDSGAGASGGGLIMAGSDGHVLVGIRTGAHWSPERWPETDFPGGPPDGSPWDLVGNTNFARAIDATLMAALRGLVSEAEGLNPAFSGQ